MKRWLTSMVVLGGFLQLIGANVGCDSSEKSAAGVAGSGGGGASGSAGAETLKPYVGTPIFKQAPVVDGQRLTISVTGANLRVGDTASVAINVNPDGARPGECADAAQHCIRFIPINNDTADRVDEVTRQMKQVEDGGNLVTRVGTDANGVLVEVLQDGKNGKYNTALSAVVEVWAPASFNGDIVANSATGDISVRGARRAATATTGLGDIAFDLSAITPGASGGDISTGNGDITFTLPGAANLNISGDARSAGGMSVHHHQDRLARARRQHDPGRHLLRQQRLQRPERGPPRRLHHPRRLGAQDRARLHRRHPALTPREGVSPGPRTRSPPGVQPREVAIGRTVPRWSAE
jgi:hypothetical protein